MDAQIEHSARKLQTMRRQVVKDKERWSEKLEGLKKYLVMVRKDVDVAQGVLPL
jgi:flagellar biosynthesis chaperone FliJ